MKRNFSDVPSSIEMNEEESDSISRLLIKKDLTAFTRRCFKIRNAIIREFLSEILCTFLLVAFGCGSVAQYVLGREKYNSYLSVNFSWGTAVTVAALIGGNVSGAHMNPAVSLSMLILGKLDILRYVIYCIAQAIGALLGSVLVFVIYLDQLNVYDPQRQTYGANATAGIWGTYPLENTTIFGNFMDQFFGTAFLILIILAIVDKNNGEVSHGIKALLIGNAVFMIGLSYGMNCGYGINPVRDFVPRLFTAMSGWGVEVFKAGNYFFWIPIVAPMLGSILATYIYALFINNHWPEPKLPSTQRSSEAYLGHHYF